MSTTGYRDMRTGLRQSIHDIADEINSTIPLMHYPLPLVPLLLTSSPSLLILISIYSLSFILIFYLILFSPYSCFYFPLIPIFTLFFYLFPFSPGVKDIPHVAVEVHGLLRRKPSEKCHHLKNAAENKTINKDFQVIPSGCVDYRDQKEDSCCYTV